MHRPQPTQAIFPKSLREIIQFMHDPLPGPFPCRLAGDYVRMSPGNRGWKGMSPNSEHVVPYLQRLHPRYRNSGKWGREKCRCCTRCISHGSCPRRETPPGRPVSSRSLRLEGYERPRIPSSSRPSSLPLQPALYPLKKPP